MGCSVSELFQDDASVRSEMYISANINQQYVTRVGDAGFTLGDAIGVYVADYKNGYPSKLQNSGNHADNIKFTLNHDGWSSETQLYWSDDKTQVDAYSYYPFVESVNNVLSLPFQVEHRQDKETDGNSLGGYEKSDFLWAKAEGVKPLSNIFLQHRHLMSCVVVTLVKGEGFNTEWASLEKSVVITNTRLSSKINLQQGQVEVDNNSSPTDIIPHNNGNEWRCVVIPQSIASGTEFIQIVVDGNLYAFKCHRTTSLIPGKINQFVIKVNKRVTGDYDFALVSESVEAWRDDDSSYKAEARAYITINVETAGSLKQCIDDANLKYDQITNLKLTGKINGLDFSFIRKSLPFLEAINMKDITVSMSPVDGKNENDVIPDEAFYKMATLKYIVFPDNLKKIGKLAFRGTGLCHEIVLPEGLTYVGAQAFDNCDQNSGYGSSPEGIWYTHNIPGISLPSTLKHIGDKAFAGCPIRQELYFPTDLEYLGDAAFESCTRIIGELRIPPTLTNIGRKCFYENIGIKGNLDIPASVTELGIGAFARTGFTTLTLHEGLRTIRAAALSGLQVLYDTQLNEYTFDDIYPFDNDLVIPSTVTVIERYAFAKTGFKHVYLPDNFEEIPVGIFYNCRELIDTLVVPSKVNHIGSNAFSGCIKLTGVVLPKNLMSIGADSFNGCFNLNYLRCMSEVPPVLEGGGHFDGVAKDNFTLVVPEGCIEAYRATPGWSEFKRISEYYNFVCRPQKARLLNKSNVREVILNADGEWTVINCPEWVHISQTSGCKKTKLTVTVDELPRGSGSRSGSVVFSLSDNGYTTSYEIEQYDSVYGEDSYVTLQSAKRGKGIDVVFIGDGYDAKDIFEGLYMNDMNQQVEYFFDVEPFKTYRDYFNVYTAYALSYESGIGTLNTLRDVKFNTMIKSSSDRMTTDFESALFYAIDNTPVEESNIDALTCVLTPNTEVYDGVTYMWAGERGGAAVALCPKSKQDYPYDARGVVQHEACGHGFGKMADEYIYHQDWIWICKCNCCGHVEELKDMHDNGWGGNLSFDGKFTGVPWQHLLEDKRFNDICDIYEGGYFHSRGVYRSEHNSCMNNNVPYFSTWSRELIVRRIKMLAGESFTLEDFVSNDSREWGYDFTLATRSPECVDESVSPPRHGTPPVILATEPKRPLSK